jgi:hypothetical protein
MSVLNFRWPIDLALTLASHGWVQLAPWRWEPEAGRLARIERMPDAAALIERGGGRMLCGSCFYEDFIKTVLTINANWSATCRMVAALVAEPGETAFPNPRRCSTMLSSRPQRRARIPLRNNATVQYLQSLTQFRSTLIATDRCDHRNGGSICSGRKVDCLSNRVVYRCKAVTIPASVQG